ncbi:LytTR family transcriptional regulator DNA-binding domain-containing protein [Alkalicoccobacillus porphyridii]|uniref:ABC transporter ATP-binding protein n=1 Tax=Alkalicoccobacillus porphyridii TaxID=2597270 RepID=A0A554A179_9BACI|nr:LytTR family transcriptional regulator DNA-binding domain-containing protein [Alkalicoccobacillus porphyridii]TSB47454.1 ABC transporter ATP-binding protein [Alkalicoccobacillus porphyridii]
MATFTINQENNSSESLPSFSLTISDSNITTIYSDTDMQTELAKNLIENTNIPIFDQKDGLYTRITVQDNVAFFHKWFGHGTTLPEILVQFELQHCAKKPLHTCSESEIRRVYFAKYFMSAPESMVFIEPIHGVDIKTTHTFISMLEKIKAHPVPVLILVANMEHALLLGDIPYKLQHNGLNKIEIADEDAMEEDETPPPTAFDHLFKIPAKIDDKIILFDPLEIDYIESQDGKGKIVINEESYLMDSTLAEIEQKLNAYGFYRCHRSYIVNLQKVREIITWSKNAYSLRINNSVQSTIPLSRTKIQEIQEKFSLK